MSELALLRPFDVLAILDAIDEHLVHEPMVASRRRKGTRTTEEVL